MDDILAEFQLLLQKISGESIEGLIKMLLELMHPEDANQLRQCAIPHYFDNSINWNNGNYKI